MKNLIVTKWGQVSQGIALVGNNLSSAEINPLFKGTVGTTKFSGAEWELESRLVTLPSGKEVLLYCNTIWGTSNWS